MENQITIKGITSYPNDERALVIIDVQYNGTLYEWQKFVPPNIPLDEFITQSSSSIYNEIQQKLNDWEVLDPKTKIVEEYNYETDNLETKEISIIFEEIVKPEIPDYYHKRKLEYPTIGDQLDALWKGLNSEEFLQMKQLIEQVKQNNPK